MFPIIRASGTPHDRRSIPRRRNATLTRPGRDCISMHLPRAAVSARALPPPPRRPLPTPSVARRLRRLQRQQLCGKHGKRLLPPRSLTSNSLNAPDPSPERQFALARSRAAAAPRCGGTTSWNKPPTPTCLTTSRKFSTPRAFTLRILQPLLAPFEARARRSGLRTRRVRANIASKQVQPARVL